MELPAGKIDSGETPEATARRELMEETGHEAGRMEQVFVFGPSVGYSDELIYVFVARDLQPLDTSPDDREIMRVDRVRLSDLKKMVLDGRIIDGTTIVTLAAFEWLATARP